MARIIIADDGIAFDGKRAAEQPIGGAEGAVAGLAEGLAARGHDVSVHNRCAAPLDFRGVAWRRLADALPPDADLYVANRSHTLVGLVPLARRRAFWVHNPAGYLLKWRYLRKLWRWRPAMVFLGPSHAAGYPAWAPGERVEIGLGLADMFRGRTPAEEPPPPRAIFTSNPLRSLDWLIELWAARIHPAMPSAELHVFAGSSHYGGLKAAPIDAVLDKARGLGASGVILRDPVERATLAEELRRSRVLLYRGDPGETFCLAAAEAQSMGVPVVTEGIGSLKERVRDGETGFVAAGSAAFAEAALRLLGDDALWFRQHCAALGTQGGASWQEVAARWERRFLL